MNDQPDRRRHLRTVVVGIVGVLLGLTIGVLLDPGPGGGDTTAGPTGTPAPAPDSPTPSDDQPAAPEGEGDERTPEGAVRAALGWMRLFTPALYLDDEARRAAVSRVAASEAEEDLQAITADIAERFREIGLTPEAAESGVRVAAPVGYQVREFTGDRAEVAIWIASVLDLGQAAPLSATWHTQVTRMRWQDDGWRLVAVETVDGPIPDITRQGDGQLVDTLQAIEAFTEFDHAP